MDRIVLLAAFSALVSCMYDVWSWDDRATKWEKLNPGRVWGEK